MERVIVFHPGALGDFILTLPFLYSFHKKNIHITLFTQSWLLELSACFNFIDEWQSLETRGIHKLYSDDFYPEELKWLKNYSMVFALFKDIRPLNDNLQKFNIPYVCGSFIPDKNFSKHIEFHLENIFGISPDYQFIPQKISQKNGPVIIHPGSGNRLKNWGIENFLKLADKLKQMGEEVIFVLGPAESEYKKLLENTGFKNFSRGLTDVFKLFQKSRLFIGNDSGITHLSAVAGTQTVAIFGSSNEVTWKPHGSHVSVIKKIAPPPCSPCITRNKMIKCSNNIVCMPEYDEVCSVVTRILGGKNE